MVREATRGPMVAPTPELPDDIPIERVLFSTKIQNALRAADPKTVGEVREISDEMLISPSGLGRGSLSDLRKKLGLPSTDGVDEQAKSPPDLRRLQGLRPTVPHLSSSGCIQTYGVSSRCCVCLIPRASSAASCMIGIQRLSNSGSVYRAGLEHNQADCGARLTSDLRRRESDRILASNR